MENLYTKDKPSLVVFATYWNEKDWVEASLAQIDSLSPAEVIICDGCFDPKYENRSTDGTREIIEKWVADRSYVRLISAQRTSKLRGLWYLFGETVRLWNLPLRIALFFYYLRTNIYRINQAATFTEMKRMSGTWKPGNWFMTFDADQFYTDEVIGKIKKICNSTENNSDLLTAKELTFFSDFKNYTDEYEKRGYNNMPHLIKENTIILPTRDITIEKYPKPKVYGKDSLLKKEELGVYMHYKFRPKDKQREKEGYLLGDRKSPDTSSYIEKEFTGKHPSVIQKYLSLQ